MAFCQVAGLGNYSGRFRDLIGVWFAGLLLCLPLQELLHLEVAGACRPLLVGFCAEGADEPAPVPP